MIIGSCTIHWRVSFLANKYLLYTGYSIAIDDCVVIPRRVVKSLVDNEFLKVDPLGPEVAVEDVKNKIMNMSKQQLNQNLSIYVYIYIYMYIYIYIYIYIHIYIISFSYKL